MKRSPAEASTLAAPGAPSPPAGGSTVTRGSDLFAPPSSESAFLVPIAKGAESSAHAGWKDRVVAGRYRLARLIGRGGQGAVWEAADSVTGARVALKLLPREGPAQTARTRREVAALRLLRLPGVVTLLDEGVDDDAIFLVMDLVEGTPFPGCALPCSWAVLAPVLVALLGTLSRVHAAGVVHRDLKPGNVLVDTAGRPVVLDFGLSSFSRVAPDGLTEVGSMLGTPAFMAPEQLRGHSLTAQTDLYSVAAMAYQALTGTIPHGEHHGPSFVFARATQPPEPARSRVPELSAEVNDLLAELLAPDPSQRPRSATEVLARLEGKRTDSGDRLAWLGPLSEVAAVVAAAASGRSVDVAGGPGSGRTRCIQEAAERLRANGQEVVWLAPGSTPFASAEPVTGPLTGFENSRLAEVRAHVEGQIVEVLGRGTVLVADDGERLDAATRDVLARCVDRGVIVRSQTVMTSQSGTPISGAQRAHGGETRVGATAGSADVVMLRSLDEQALRALFTGPERLFHVREDAARALWARTEGVPAYVAHEAAAWVTAGLARWDGGRLAMGRDAIERLEAHLHLTPPRASDAATWDELPSRMRDLLCWVALATPNARVELLARVAGEAPWRVELGLEQLDRDGAIRALDDGTVRSRIAPDVDAWWGPDRRRAAHRALADALPEGAAGRLVHTAAGSEPLEFVLEALVAARTLSAEGRVDRAVAVIEEGLHVLRNELANDPASELVESEMLAAWLDVALSDFRPQAVDRALYALMRARAQSPAIARMEAIARAAIAASTDPPRALEMLDALPAEAPSALELRRQALRMVAARSTPEEMEERTFADVSAWARATDDREALARLDGWAGRVRYRRGRFDEAAELHLRSAEGLGSALDRAAARINAASALLEAFRHEDARSVGEQALTEIGGLRSPYLEARAEWVVRAADVRTKRALRPDIELLDAVESLGVRPMAALVALTEAVAAFRIGDRRAAVELCDRAARRWTQARTYPDMALLARALGIACDAPIDEAEARALWDRAMVCEVPGVGLQALALIAKGCPRVAKPVALEPLLRGIPESCYSKAMDVLSADEAIALLTDAMKG